MKFVDFLETGPSESLKDAYGLFCKGKYDEAFDEFSKYPEDAEALYCKAYMVMNGLGVEEDDKEAIDILKVSAEKGYLPAISELADVYRQFDNTAETAYDIYLKSTGYEDPFMLNALAIMIRDGTGCEADEYMSSKFYNRAIAAADTLAVEDKAFEYLYAGNIIVARFLLMRSAILGSPISSEALSYLYLTGNGVKEDEELGEVWDELAYDDGIDDLKREEFRGHEKWFAEYTDIESWFE